MHLSYPYQLKKISKDFRREKVETKTSSQNTTTVGHVLYCHALQFHLLRISKLSARLRMPINQNVTKKEQSNNKIRQTFSKKLPSELAVFSALFYNCSLMNKCSVCFYKRDWLSEKFFNFDTFFSIFVTFARVINVVSYVFDFAEGIVQGCKIGVRCVRVADKILRKTIRFFEWPSRKKTSQNSSTKRVENSKFGTVNSSTYLGTLWTGKIKKLSILAAPAKGCCWHASHKDEKYLSRFRAFRTTADCRGKGMSSRECYVPPLHSFQCIVCTFSWKAQGCPLLLRFVVRHSIS